MLKHEKRFLVYLGTSRREATALMTPWKCAYGIYLPERSGGIGEHWGVAQIGDAAVLAAYALQRLSEDLLDKEIEARLDVIVSQSTVQDRMNRAMDRLTRQMERLPVRPMANERIWSGAASPWRLVAGGIRGPLTAREDELTERAKGIARKAAVHPGCPRYGDVIADRRGICWPLGQ